MYMCQKGGGVGHCAVQVHGNDGNTTATLEMDIEVGQENGGVDCNLDEDKDQFNASDVDDKDSDAGEARDNDNFDMEEYKDELKD